MTVEMIKNMLKWWLEWNDNVLMKSARISSIDNLWMKEKVNNLKYSTFMRWTAWIANKWPSNYYILVSRLLHFIRKSNDLDHRQCYRPTTHHSCSTEGIHFSHSVQSKNPTVTYFNWNFGFLFCVLIHKEKRHWWQSDGPTNFHSSWHKTCQKYVFT